MVRLNGTAGVYPQRGNNGFQTSFEPEITNYRHKSQGGAYSPEMLDFIMHEYDTMQNKNDITYSYSWEQTKSAMMGLEFAKTIAYKTEILVVIGYSFPFVNRDFDNEIFRNMRNLRKIYIQYHEGISDERLKLLQYRIAEGDHIPIELIVDKDEFFLPPEL